jgi:2,4-dienoyl-CoA reductase-like NADH-dependent reductase (Old Yellow Enzyme family)
MLVDGVAGIAASRVNCNRAEESRMPGLFSPLTIRGVTFPNRAWVSPMCQYSAVDGVVGDWHLVHLGSFAAGRAGLIMTEATAVSAEGRISIACPGIWNDEQATAWSRIVDYVHGQGGVIGMQLAHAGRKASTNRPWNGGGYITPEDGGWNAIAPSAIAFATLPEPREMSVADIDATVEAFRAAALRAAGIGVDVIELHAAHGYLLHEFLSPLTNTRDDEYGGTLDNRMRFLIAAATAVREACPDKPLFVRISVTDWIEGGWDLEQSVVLAERLKDVGVDLIDASSGGLRLDAVIPDTVDYQTGLAAELRARTSLPIGAVGRITEPKQADGLIHDGSADAVFLARQLLRDPHWPLRAAHELGEEIAWAPQYQRAASWRS